MATRHNLTGEVFNNLTVIAEDFSKNKTAWLCRCLCGGKTIVVSGNLKSGAVKSCGCLSHRDQVEKLVGNKYGRLTAIERGENSPSGRIRWVCLCECGKTTLVFATSLKNGGTQSCGCLQKERTGDTSRTHGMTETKEYKAWCLMKGRCYVKTNNKYYLYGGNGIIVSERWFHSFENFFADMGPKPTPNHTLDRFPNQTGNYEPSNCRWATQITQQGNRTNNVWHEHNGKKMIQSDWGRYFGVGNGAIIMHLKRGKTFPEIHSFYMNKNKIAV